MAAQRYKYYEFFAGGGMARAGLGEKWQCLLANDFDRKKANTYRVNWSDSEMVVGDIRTITSADLPKGAHLAWASFPCQDLSLAGGGAGLKGERSGTFWPFWSLMKSLDEQDRSPSIVVLENVCGALSSHGGSDFSSICDALGNLEYQFGAVIIDAALFLPQSRPRLFIIAVHRSLSIPVKTIAKGPSPIWHTTALRNAYNRLSDSMREKWIWWDLPKPSCPNRLLSDIVEDKPTDVNWHTRGETQALLNMMSQANLAKVEEARRSGQETVGTIYKRTRRDEAGKKVQRAEVRFDNLAGCLRTPAGGSSRQLIIVVQKNQIRSRLISARETARLMGLPDDYILPPNYNEAYHLTGDGVAVPVVRHLAQNVLEPVLRNQKRGARFAA